MNFELTEEQKAVKEAARDFAQNVLKPGVIDRDRDQKFPVEEMKQLEEWAKRNGKRKEVKELIKSIDTQIEKALKEIYKDFRL